LPRTLVPYHTVATLLVGGRFFGCLNTSGNRPLVVSLLQDYSIQEHKCSLASPQVTKSLPLPLDIITSQ
jgi:hypothetical protein